MKKSKCGRQAKKMKGQELAFLESNWAGQISVSWQSGRRRGRGFGPGVGESEVFRDSGESSMSTVWAPPRKLFLRPLPLEEIHTTGYV